MAKIIELAKKVSEYWLSHGVDTQGVTSEEIEKTEKRVGSLPESYKDFIFRSGIPKTEDSNGIYFWSLGDLVRADHLLSKAGYEISLKDELVVIADYMQESWWYGLWLTGEDYGRVSLILGGDINDPQEPIGDFQHFLQCYLNDSAEIYK